MGVVQEHQVAPISPVVNFLSVGGQIPIGDYSNESCVIPKLQEFDRGLARGEAVGGDGEE